MSEVRVEFDPPRRQKQASEGSFDVLFRHVSMGMRGLPRAILQQQAVLADKAQLDGRGIHGYYLRTGGKAGQRREPLTVGTGFYLKNHLRIRLSLR